MIYNTMTPAKARTRTKGPGATGSSKKPLPKKAANKTKFKY
jgi:hypothetical protein